MSVEAGDQAPEFHLPADGNRRLGLSDFGGRYLVLYFYPKDNTPGCTNEAQAFRDLYDSFTARGAEIAGVSRDGVKSHDNFKAKHGIPFPLLSDADATAVQAYGVGKEKTSGGQTKLGITRSTFLIDPDGTIIQVWRQVKVPGHAEKVLEALKAAQTGG